MKHCKALDLLSAILVFVGALNWGLVGAFNFNLVDAIFGSASNIAVHVIYVVVGLFGIYNFIRQLNSCCGKSCKKD